MVLLTFCTIGGCLGGQIGVLGVYFAAAILLRFLVPKFIINGCKETAEYCGLTKPETEVIVIIEEEEDEEEIALPPIVNCHAVGGRLTTTEIYPDKRAQNVV